MQNGHWLSTTTTAFTGAKVELATVEEWTQAEKESIRQESAKTNTKAGKLSLVKILPSQLSHCHRHCCYHYDGCHYHPIDY